MTTRHPFPSQHGFILPLVMVLLIILMASSASFFQRSSQDTRLSGVNRDYDQARLLAESSMNLVLGRIVNFTAASTVAATTAAVVPCIAPANAPAVNDLNCDGLPDANQAKPDSFTPALPLPVGYEFFASTGAGITESTPRIIQMVANGEARNTGMAANSQAVLLNGANQLRVNDLFIDASSRPLLLTQDKSGLTFSGNTWSAENKPEKAAVWLEIARDPDPAHASWYDLYVESAAQVGTAKAYVQRFVGAYTDMLGAQVIAPLSEASNHP